MILDLDLTKVTMNHIVTDTIKFLLLSDIYLVLTKEMYFSTVYNKQIKSFLPYPVV